MPRKVRDLISDLKKAGFINEGGKGSHRNFKKDGILVTVSGHEGDDVHFYQEKKVKQAIERTSL